MSNKLAQYEDHRESAMQPSAAAAPILPFDDIAKIGRVIAASGLFGVRTPEAAVALCLIAQAEGLHPATAARDYHIIQGQPALKADSMLARFQQGGGRVQFTELTDSRVTATFSHPSGGTVEIDWDMERAQKAGLGRKDMWAKYPRQMLRARVISEGIRTVYPGILSGMYTPEEVADFEPITDTTTAPSTSGLEPEAQSQLTPPNSPSTKPQQPDQVATPASAPAPMQPKQDDAMARFMGRQRLLVDKCWPAKSGKSSTFVCLMFDGDSLISPVEDTWYITVPDGGELGNQLRDRDQFIIEASIENWLTPQGELRWLMRDVDLEPAANETIDVPPDYDELGPPLDMESGLTPGS